ncbi:MAG: AEC family transporter [Phycisphaerae bacterium]|nr:AEC family transporter [Phycisphaerae bacterium]MDW8261264.1 AEC family transporter [Phycisphaerales bacterium]
MIAEILLTILAPILLMIGLGVMLQVKFRLDLNSLSKLNIYLFTPAFIFHNVYLSRLPWSDMAAVAGITVFQSLALGALVWIGGKLLRVDRTTLAAVALAVMFYNSGNYGLPLAELAYPARSATSGASAASIKDGAAVQAFVVMTMNVLTFTVGMGIAAYAGAGDWRKAVKVILQMPTLYGLAAALGVRWWLSGDPSRVFPVVLAKPVEYLAAGLVPMALITLGAQLGSNPRWPRWKPISAVLVLRLILAPMVMAGVLFLLHLSGWRALDLWPWPAELLILTAAVPTAVNTLLLTLELKGDATLAADCVFWTTVFSCLTITLWLVVLRLLAG